MLMPCSGSSSARDFIVAWYTSPHVQVFWLPGYLVYWSHSFEDLFRSGHTTTVSVAAILMVLWSLIQIIAPSGTQSELHDNLILRRIVFPTNSFSQLLFLLFLNCPSWPAIFTFGLNPKPNHSVSLPAFVVHNHSTIAHFQFSSGLALFSSCAVWLFA